MNNTTYEIERERVYICEGSGMKRVGRYANFAFEETDIELRGNVFCFGKVNYGGVVCVDS